MPEIRRCAYCRKKFEVPYPSDKRRHCSLSCSAKNKPRETTNGWKGGVQEMIVEDVIKMPEFMERFLSSIEVDPLSGCWNWKLGKTTEGGYGRVKVAGIDCRSHRISYQIFLGNIPDGLLVCHHCDNPPCVNPSHLFVGTYEDNMQDRRQKGWFLSDR